MLVVGEMCVVGDGFADDSKVHVDVVFADVKMIQ
jgi:hypothetical protein